MARVEWKLENDARRCDYSPVTFSRRGDDRMRMLSHECSQHDGKEIPSIYIVANNDTSSS